jgi:hypothetical protein
MRLLRCPFCVRPHPHERHHQTGPPQFENLQQIARKIISMQKAEIDRRDAEHKKA